MCLSSPCDVHYPLVGDQGAGEHPPVVLRPPHIEDGLLFPGAVPGNPGTWGQLPITCIHPGNTLCNEYQQDYINKAGLESNDSLIEGHLPSKIVFYWRLSSVKGHLSSKVVFRHRSSSVKGRLLSRSSSVKGRHPSKVVFCHTSSSVEGHLPSKVIFHPRSSSIKGRLPSKVVFRQKSSSIQGRLPS